jgi:hypothetical protein
MCSAQLDDRASYDDPKVTYQRLRRSEAGVLAILDAARSQVATRVLPLTGPVPLPKAVKRRIFAFHGGPVLPTSGPRQH